MIIVIQEAVFHHDVYGPFNDLEDALEAMRQYLEATENPGEYHDADGHHDYVFYDHSELFKPKELGRLASDRRGHGKAKHYNWSEAVEEVKHK